MTTPKTLTASEIAELVALDGAATQCPWIIVTNSSYTEVRAGTQSLAGDAQYYPWMFDIEDARLLVALRNAAPALLAMAGRCAEADANAARADAIALTASKDANELEAERDSLKAEVARLAAERLNLIGEAGAASTRANRLEAEVERLRAAMTRVLTKLDGLVPDEECRCRDTASPCKDCEEWGKVRGAIDQARAALRAGGVSPCLTPRSTRR